MNNFLLFSIFILLSCSTQKLLVPPHLPKEEKILVHHNDKRIDPYYYVQDKTDPRVIPYLEAENQYAEKMTAHTSIVHKTLVQEFTNRIKQTDSSVPYEYGDYQYYSKTVEHKDYPIYARTHRKNQTEEVLLDLNELLAKNQFSTLELNDYEISFDHKILAYSIDTTGSRDYTIYFYDTATKQLLPDTIDKAQNIVWANDHKTIFYTIHDSARRSHQVYRYTLGNPQSKTLVYHEKDRLYDVSLQTTKDQQFIILDVSSTLTNEQYFLPTNEPLGRFRLIEKRQKGVRYFTDSHQKDFFLLTNYRAKNFRLVKTTIANQQGKKNWQEIVAENSVAKLNDVSVFSRHLLLSYVEDGNARLKYLTIGQKSLHPIDFGSNVSVDYPYINPQFDSQKIIITHQSMREPPSWYTYSFETKEKILLKQQEIGAGFSENNYVLKQIFVRARDGQNIPVSIIHHKNVNFSATSSHPFYLYGYGSYGSVMYPMFSPYRISLLDRGVVYGMAHIRGGGDRGERWKEDGKFLKKKNSFYDFIDVSKFLIQGGFTSPTKLAIEGRSAGGLLIGAVLNEAPELFKVAFAGVPFVDVVTTMLDDTIPLTTGEYEEWGNPNDKKYYDYMKSYSPYDNVRPLAYPTILVTTGINDSQVGYWEPTKWVLKLRENSIAKNPIVFKINLDVGHGGASGRSDRYMERAFEMAFMLDQLGIKQ